MLTWLLLIIIFQLGAMARSLDPEYQASKASKAQMRASYKKFARLPAAEQRRRMAHYCRALSAHEAAARRGDDPHTAFWAVYAPTPPTPAPTYVWGPGTPWPTAETYQQALAHAQHEKARRLAQETTG